MKKEKKPFEDDGRVVADMSGVMPYRPFKPAKKKNLPNEPREEENFEPMSKQEARWAAFAALKAALLIGAVFIAGMGLFLLFCVYVWFR